jgi:hypothetical protein
MYETSQNDQNLVQIIEYIQKNPKLTLLPPENYRGDYEKIVEDIKNNTSFKDILEYIKNSSRI